MLSVSNNIQIYPEIHSSPGEKSLRNHIYSIMRHHDL